MRKTLSAMLGLAALAVWALPALAGDVIDPPKAQVAVPQSLRAGAIGALARHQDYTATLSGTIVNQAVATTTWFLYPGACQDRASGTWAPKATTSLDNLNSYTSGSTGGYGLTDQSLVESLWHKVTTSVPSGERPTSGISGTAAIWCGKYDPAGVITVGYPNATTQMLYIDTGSHSSNYTLNLTMYQSTEWGYDYVHLIGGGANAVDPFVPTLTNFQAVVNDGTVGTSRLLVTWTGSIQTSTPGASSINATLGGVQVTGSGSGQPQTIPVSITLSAADRAVYLLFTSDSGYSSADGLWPFGSGVVLDNISSSDNGAIFSDGTPPSGVDPSGSGIVIQGSFGTTGYIAARVGAGVGELWQVVDGSFASTNDNCQAQKNDATDKMFFGAEASSKKTVPGQSNSIVSCAFPVPAGTASIRAEWGMYFDLPSGAGYAQWTEYRYFKNGLWSNWVNTNPGGSVFTGNIKTWFLGTSSGADELAGAVQADSVQIRYNLTCFTYFAEDGQHCQQIDYGVLYDDLNLRIVTGVPAPVFGIFVSQIAQSTFIDGTLEGLNCSTPPCWPGIRGSETPETPGNTHVDIHDNFNSPLGDSVAVTLVTGLRKNGMGINWRQGFVKSVSEGQVIAITNASYNAAYDVPRVIYRLFDPSTKNWSPWDSSALDANSVQVSAGPPPDTTVISNQFRMNWPPRDKVGLSLPGGFTMNGVGAYNNLAFLPRGTRLQYYFKAVDINGGIAYQFTTDNVANEIADLPTLPGSSAMAPDIIEFDVLPGVYAPGHAGTLLGGKTNTPILNLDGSYAFWYVNQDLVADPVTQALRGMGVRADRYRMLQGLDLGSNVGGHELTTAPDNQRVRRGSNYFPNMTEYSIRESLSTWYRIVIQSSHSRSPRLEDESDARLLEEWWRSGTPGTNGGDRCMFVSGDDYFNALMNTSAADPAIRRKSYGNNVLGVNSAIGSWNGTVANLYPTVEDRFAAPGAGPGLVAGYTYPVDGGCSYGPNRFDALVKMGGTDAQNAALYPLFGGVSDVAAVANMSEKDAVTDNDRSKALGYGYSIQYVRRAGVPTTATNYLHSGLQERMQILYKFLASCRGIRAGAADTAKCWPCPTDANIMGNWAALPGFQTGTYGGLYAIQDNQAATGVDISDASAAPRVNRLDGNFPNPFNPQTTIRFSAAQAGKVTLRIFNVGGQLVRTLNANAEVGANEVRWNGRRDDGAQLASGIYFYKVKFADGSESGSRMALVK